MSTSTRSHIPRHGIPISDQTHADTPDESAVPRADQPTNQRAAHAAPLQSHTGTTFADSELPGLPKLGILAIISVTAGGAGVVAAVSHDPAWAIPATVFGAAFAVIVTGAFLLWAIAAVRNARGHAETHLRATWAPPRIDTTDIAGRGAPSAGYADDDPDDDDPFADDPFADAQRGAGFGSRPDGAQRAPWHAVRRDSIDSGAASGSSPERLLVANLARRVQTFIARCLDAAEDLERTHEDPETLAGIYKVIHRLTISRRQGENLAVLGGQAPARRSHEPVDFYELLLNAMAEVEQFTVIEPGRIDAPAIHGHVAAEITHLLAELLENATQFTPPGRLGVEVHAVMVEAGLAVQVWDSGLGFPADRLEAVNRVLDGTDPVQLSDLVNDGRIGLAVVRELAARHQITVELRLNNLGGVVATVVIPRHCLAEPAQAKQPMPEPGRAASTQRPSTARQAGHGTEEKPPSATPHAAPRPPLAALGSPAHVAIPDPSLGERVGDRASDRETMQITRVAAAPTPVGSHAPELDRSHPDASAPVTGEGHHTGALTGGRVHTQAGTPARQATAWTDPSDIYGTRRGARHDGRDQGAANPHHADEHDEALPVLPTREPGRNLADLTTQGLPSPPPLPVRGPSGHMPAQLRDAPDATDLGPIVQPGHRSDLLSEMLRGRARASKIAPPNASDRGPDGGHHTSTYGYPYDSAAQDSTNGSPGASATTETPAPSDGQPHSESHQQQHPDHANHTAPRGEATIWPTT